MITIAKKITLQERFRKSRFAPKIFSTVLVILGLEFYSACQLNDVHDLAENKIPQDHRLMPDLDLGRRERLQDIAGRFVTPEGFRVEQVANQQAMPNNLHL